MEMGAPEAFVKPWMPPAGHAAYPGMASTQCVPSESPTVPVRTWKVSSQVRWKWGPGLPVAGLMYHR